jgi:uncharacterized phage protein gp47/JayE
MADYQYITETGVIVPDTETILNEVTQEYKDVFGEDLDTRPETPQGALIVAEALAREAVVRNNAALANQINPNLCGGIFQDAICALTGLQRDAESYSVTPCTLTGVPGTVIPVNTSLARSENGDIFYCTQTVTLSSLGTATVDFKAQEPGAIAAPAGTLNIIVTNVLGWETITNTADAVLGEPTQSDLELYALRVNTLALQGSTLAEAITSGVLDVPDVRSLTFRENVENTTQVIDSVTLVAHSIYLCVDGGTDQNVGTAIFARKSGGCNYNNGASANPVSVNITEPSSGQIFAVKFDRPTLIAVATRITIKANSTVANPTDAVKKAVLDYANGLLSGEIGLITGASVSPYEFGGAVNREIPTIYVKKVERITRQPYRLEH